MIGRDGGRWSGSGWVALESDPKLFMFSLTRSTKLPRNAQSHGTYNNNGYGPTWGGGHDLTTSDSGSWAGNAYCNMESASDGYDRAGLGNQQFCGHGTAVHWTPADLEVYYYHTAR